MDEPEDDQIEVEDEEVDMEEDIIEDNTEIEEKEGKDEYDELDGPKEFEDEEGDAQVDNELDEKEDIKSHKALESDNNNIRNIYITKQNERVTSSFVQKNEMASLLSLLTEFISKNGTSIIKDYDEIAKGKNSAKEIAEAIILSRKCPFIIRRYIGTDEKSKIGYYEDWNPNEMSFKLKIE